MTRKFAPSQLNPPAKLIRSKPSPPRTSKTSGFSFYKKDIEKGAAIHFIKNPVITAVVAVPHEVSYDGKTWRLSALTRLIYTQRGEVNNSGAYRGADHWMYGGVKLTKLVDKRQY